MMEISPRCVPQLSVLQEQGRDFYAPVDWKMCWKGEALLLEKALPLCSCGWMVVCMIELWLVKLDRGKDAFICNYFHVFQKTLRSCL